MHYEMIKNVLYPDSADIAAKIAWSYSIASLLESLYETSPANTVSSKNFLTESSRIPPACVIDCGAEPAA